MSIDLATATARPGPSATHEPGRPSRRTTLLVSLLLALLTALSWLPRLGGPIDLRWDGGAYFIIGTSLAQGHGYRLRSEPGDIPSSVHAPFLPALVALHERVLDSTDPRIVGTALRITTLVCAMAYAVAIFLFLAADIAWPWAAAAALLGVLQPQYAYFSDALYAETFFGLLTLVFLILQRRRAGGWALLFAGIFAALAYSARTAGIALLVAWVADTLLHRTFRRLPLVLVMAAAPVLAWTAWIKTAEGSPEYREPAYAYQTAPYVYFNVSYAKNIFTLKDPWNPQAGPLTTQALVTRVSNNLRALPARLGESVSSWEAPRRLSLILATLVLGGTLLLLVQRRFLIVGYMAMSIAAVMLTPFDKQFIRYLMPLYPLSMLAMFKCLAWLEALARRRLAVGTATWGRLATGVLLGVIALVEGQGLVRLYEHHDLAYAPAPAAGQNRLFYDAPLGTQYDEALGQLRRLGRSTDRVAATDPQRVYLLTGMQAVLPPFELDGAKAQTLIDTVPVRFLVAETQPQPLGLGAYYRYTAALLAHNPRCWNEVWKSRQGGVAIFERAMPIATCARSP